MTPILTVFTVIGGYAAAAWVLGALVYYLFLKEDDVSGDMWLATVLFAPVALLPVLAWGAVTVWLEERRDRREEE